MYKRNSGTGANTYIFGFIYVYCYPKNKKFLFRYCAYTRPLYAS